MKMTSACFINLMTNDGFPELEDHPTIQVNGCFHFSTSSHGSDGRPIYSVCLFMLYLFIMLYCVCKSFLNRNHRYNLFSPYDN